MDEKTLAVLKTLGEMDNPDSGISFDVKTKKSSKIQNVHVTIPSWLLVLGTVLGGASALVLINEILKELTGEGLLPEIPEFGPKAGVKEGAKNVFDPLGLF